MAFPSISLNSTFFMQARPYRDNQPIHDHISTNSLIKNVSGGFDVWVQSNANTSACVIEYDERVLAAEFGQHSTLT